MMNSRRSKKWIDADIRIKSAMKALLSKNDFSDISVSAICKEAKINRSTFYSHYLNITEVIDSVKADCVSDIQEQFGEYFNNLSKHGHAPNAAHYYLPLLTYITQNRRLFVRIFDGFDYDYTQKAFLGSFLRYCNYYFDNIKPDERSRYYFIAFHAGLVSCMNYWLKSGCSESETEFAEILLNCVPEILRRNSADENER